MTTNLGRRIAHLEAAAEAVKPIGPVRTEDFMAGRLPKGWSLSEAVRLSYEGAAGE
jgi:hypothetical protein